MENGNNKVKKIFTGAGLVLGLSMWSLFAWGCTNKEEVEDKPEVKKVEEKEVAKDLDVGYDPNLANSIQSFLQSWTVNNKSEISLLITENFDSVTGYYAYPVTITKTGKTVGLDLGLSKVEVPKQNIVVYQGFNDTLAKYKENDTGLAIVKYNSNNIDNVEIYKLSAPLPQIQEALLNTELETKQLTDSVKDKKESKTYKTLTATDWKGMTLLASRDIISKEMAPIFIIPNASLDAKKDLDGTFYYVIAGELVSSDEHNTILKSYENKTIYLDFGISDAKEHEGKPTWVHVITKDGKIQNVEFQSFDGASVKTMAEGMIGYISSSAAVELDSEGEKYKGD